MLPNPTLLGRWAFASVPVACLSSTRAVAQTPADQPSEPKFPSTKISGLMFGDDYWFNHSHRDTVSTTDPTSITELHGLWFRRLYFTFDYNYSERLTTRFRLEMNSNGDFTGDDLVPYVKDAYLKWTCTGEQQLTLGIQPTLPGPVNFPGRRQDSILRLTFFWTFG